MFVTTLLFAAILQQCPGYTGPVDGTIHSCGQAYRLICSRSGTPANCTEKRGAEVDHFEVRDEHGQVAFEKSIHDDELFSDVAPSATGYAGRQQIFSVSVEKRTSRDHELYSAWYVYYFNSTPSGLVAFQPALGCASGSRTSLPAVLGNPSSFPPSGVALGCEFDTSYFRFTAELYFDFVRLRVVPAPSNETFPVELSVEAPTTSTLRIYRDHRENAVPSGVRVAPGQRTRILAAWVPILLKPSEDFETVSYDPNELWLEIELKSGDKKFEKFWIHGSKSFQIIGLRPAGNPPS